MKNSLSFLKKFLMRLDFFFLIRETPVTYYVFNVKMGVWIVTNVMYPNTTVNSVSYDRPPCSGLWYLSKASSYHS